MTVAAATGVVAIILIMLLVVVVVVGLWLISIVFTIISGIRLKKKKDYAPFIIFLILAIVLSVPSINIIRYFIETLN